MIINNDFKEIEVNKLIKNIESIGMDEINSKLYDFYNTNGWSLSPRFKILFENNDEIIVTKSEGIFKLSNIESKYFISRLETYWSYKTRKLHMIIIYDLEEQNVYIYLKDNDNFQKLFIKKSPTKLTRDLILISQKRRRLTFANINTNNIEYTEGGCKTKKINCSIGNLYYQLYSTKAKTKDLLLELLELKQKGRKTPIHNHIQNSLEKFKIVKDEYSKFQEKNND